MTNNVINNKDTSVGKTGAIGQRTLVPWATTSALCVFSPALSFSHLCCEFGSLCSQTGSNRKGSAGKQVEIIHHYIYFNNFKW